MNNFTRILEREVKLSCLYTETDDIRQQIIDLKSNIARYILNYKDLEKDFAQDDLHMGYDVYEDYDGYYEDFTKLLAFVLNNGMDK